MNNTIDFKQRVFSPAENALLNTSMKYHGLFRVGQVLRLQGPLITFEALQTAVRCLQRRHPFLRSRLRNNPAGRNTYLLQEDPILELKVRELSRKRDDHLNFWKQEWREREKDIPVIGEGLAEFWILQDPDDRENDEAPREIVVICEHSICDGISLSTIAHELLLALGEEEPSLFEKSLDWPIPMETAIEQSLSPWTRYITLGKCILKAIYQNMTIGKKTARIPYSDINFALQDAHKYCHSEGFSTSLTKEETQQLSDKCRNEDTTVTSAISTALLCAISTQVNDKNGYLTHMIPADLRRRYEPSMPNNFLSLQASGISAFALPVADVPKASKDMWKLSRQIGQHIKDNINAGDVFAVGMLLSKVFEREEGPLDYTNNPTCGISSWGRLCFQERYGQWTLDGMTALGNTVHSFSPFTVAYTVNGVLTVGSGVAVPLFSSTVLEKLHNDMMEHLHRMIVD